MGKFFSKITNTCQLDSQVRLSKEKLSHRRFYRLVKSDRKTLTTCSRKSKMENIRECTLSKLTQDLTWFLMSSTMSTKIKHILLLIILTTNQLKSGSFLKMMRPQSNPQIAYGA